MSEQTNKEANQNPANRSHPYSGRGKKEAVRTYERKVRTSELLRQQQEWEFRQ
jgi:hypothetical protein